MEQVWEILRQKGSEVWSIAPQATVFEALEKMAEKEIGALLVTDGGKLVGIISERDYARKVVLKGKTSKEATVQELMSSNVVYVRPDQPLEEAMVLMSEKHIRHLPVIDNDKLVGMISIGDVVKAIISDKDFHIKQLENYIYGRS